MRKIFIMIIFLTLSFAENTKEKKDSKPVCGEKKYCKQMTSCKEAMFYFQECGLKKLDKDKDGTPCENVCK